VRKTLLSALALALLLTPSPFGRVGAQESALKPVLTVSLSGVDAIKKDLGTVADASEMSELAMVLDQVPLQGLDASKPWGVVVQTDGSTFPVMAFVPVTSLEQLVGLVEAMSQGQADLPDPDDDGVYEISGPMERSVFLQQKGNWAFLTDSREALDTAPADPIPLLGGLQESYALAIRLVVKNIPPEVRSMPMSMLEMGMAMGMQKMPDESDEQFAIRQKAARRSMDQFKKLLNETDSLQIGLAVDAQSKAVRLDIEMTAVEGTSTAADYALAAEAKSSLTGFFLPEAALTALWAGTMSETDAAQLTDMIDTMDAKAMENLDEQELGASEKELAKGLLGDLIDVIRRTVASRRVDLGFSVVADADSLNLVAAGFVADPAKLERLAKQVANLAVQENAEAAEAIQLDAEEYQGVRLHLVEVPAEALPGDDVPAMLVGDTATAVLGFGAENVYLAAGPKAVELLKAAIDGSRAATAQAVLPLRLSMSASAIGRILEGVGAADEIEVPGLVDALQQAGPNDHVTITAEAVDGGVRTRIELEQGVLQVIGAAVRAGMNP